MTITKEEAIQKIKDGLYFDDPIFDAFRDDKEVVLEALKYYESVFDLSKYQRQTVLSITFKEFSHSIQELCKDKDPIEALEAAIRQEKFQAELPDQPAVKRKKTF